MIAWMEKGGSLSADADSHTVTAFVIESRGEHARNPNGKGSAAAQRKRRLKGKMRHPEASPLGVGVIKASEIVREEGKNS
jgi:hypothetical protein